MKIRRQNLEVLTVVGLIWVWGNKRGDGPRTSRACFIKHFPTPPLISKTLKLQLLTQRDALRVYIYAVTTAYCVSRNHNRKSYADGAVAGGSATTDFRVWRMGGREATIRNHFSVRDFTEVLLWFIVQLFLSTER